MRRYNITLWPIVASFLSRLFKPLVTRALDAAGGGKRWANQPRIIALNQDLLGGATVAAQRASYFARNNPNVAAAIASTTDVASLVINSRRLAISATKCRIAVVADVVC